MGDKRKFRIEVTQIVDVELDASKFTEEFMAEFRESFFEFHELADHAEHLAQFQARGVYDLDSHSGAFVEGYGPSKDMGISARVIDIEINEVRHGG